MSQGGNVLSDGIEPVGSVHHYADGLHVRIDEVVPYEPVSAAGCDGYRQGDDLIRCTLYLSNGTGGPVDLSGIGLSVRGGPYGKTGRRVTDSASGSLDGAFVGTLRTGRRVSATWAYSIPAGTGQELDLEVRFDGTHPRESVTFSTAPPLRRLAPAYPPPGPQ